MIKIPSLCSQYAVNMQVQNGSSTTAGMGVRARLHTPGDRRAGSHPRPPHETFSSQVNLVSDSPSCAWERDWTGCRHLAHAKRAHEVIPVAGHSLLLALLGEFLEQAGPLRLNFLGGTALLTSRLHSRAEIP